MRRGFIPDFFAIDVFQCYHQRTYMKLVSLNCEGEKHFDRIVPFLLQGEFDCICLQECPAALENRLKNNGYYTTFVPLTLREGGAHQYAEGLLIASKAIHTADTYFYSGGDNSMQLFAKERYRETMKKALVYAIVGDIPIATTHFTWTPNGSKPNEYQKEDIITLVTLFDTLPPHVVCGDFNIPRVKNDLYDQYLLPRYIDAVPLHYSSSLDQNLHRLGNDVSKKHLFTDYMVDYIFTQEPILATDVQLVFGLSDHAAVVGTIERV